MRTICKVICVVLLFSVSSCSSPEKEFKEAVIGGNVEGFENFIAKYPDHSFVDEARNKIDSILYGLAIAENKIGKLEDFIKGNPSSKYIEDAKHRLRAINRVVLIASNRDGNDEIYCVNIDGKNPVNLTQNQASENDPAWSPDGMYIAFSSDRTGTDEIYIMKYDGSDQKQITKSAGSDPTWSPDGKSIAYTSNGDIFVIALSDTIAHNITNSQSLEFEPNWSPGGKYIAFTSNRNGSGLDIYIMDNSGENIKQLTNDLYYNHCPSFSPGEDKIVYVASKTNVPISNPIFYITADHSLYLIDRGKALSIKDDLVVINTDGNSREVIISDKLYLVTPSWVSDESQILFTMNHDKSISDVYIVAMDDREILNLTSSDENDFSPDSYPTGPS